MRLEESTEKFPTRIVEKELMDPVVWDLIHQGDCRIPLLQLVRVIPSLQRVEWNVKDEEVRDGYSYPSDEVTFLGRVNCINQI